MKKIFFFLVSIFLLTKICVGFGSDYLPTNNYWFSPTSSYLQTTNYGGYDILINGISKYMNFGTIIGSLGYGFRDNSGVMQYRNSDGSWQSFGGTAGSKIESWDSSQSYTSGDIVNYLGRFYIASDSSIGKQPSLYPDYWELYDNTPPITTSTDPALNAATSSANIDAYSGVVITLTTTGNNQTLQSPTSSTAKKSFLVINNDNSTDPINIIDGTKTITLAVGEAQNYVWDGSAWVAVEAVDAEDIAFTPAGDISATNVQSAIEELDTEKVAKAGDTMTGSLIISPSSNGDQLTLKNNEDATGARNVDFTFEFSDGDGAAIKSTRPSIGAYTDAFLSFFTGGDTSTAKATLSASGNLGMTGSIGSTGSRITKLWATDLEVTNEPTVNGVAPYALLAGRSGGQTLIGSDTTSEDLTLQDNSVDGNSITITEIIAKLDNLVEDTAPQLGGDLDVNGKTITSASNGNVEIAPNGTGDFIVNTDDLFVDTSSGKVGIGTTTPASALEVSIPPLGVSTYGEVAKFNSTGALDWPYITIGEAATNKGLLLAIEKSLDSGTGQARIGMHGANGYCFKYNSNGIQVDASAGTSLTRNIAFNIKPRLATHIGLQVVGAASQSVDFFNIIDSSSNNIFKVNSSGNVGIGTTPNQKLTVEGTQSLKEQSSAESDTAGYGQIWVKNSVPNELWFTNDAGDDQKLGSSIFEGATANSTPTEIFLAGSSNRFTIKENSVVSFRLIVSAYDSTANHAGSWTVNDGVIKRDGSNNTTLVNATVNEIVNESTDWDFEVTADDTNEALKITVTGDGTNSVSWSVRLDIINVSI